MRRREIVRVASGSESGAPTQPCTWQAAWREAVSLAEERPMLSNTGLRQHVAQHTMGAYMLALNRLLQVWALALERWHFSKTNTPQSK